MRQNAASNPYSLRRRLVAAGLVALALHLFFVLIVGPYLKFASAPQMPTEVVQITPQDLLRIKQKIDTDKPALLQQELREEFRTKEAPKDAKFVGAFNQTVPKETVAGAQRDAPQHGGGDGENGAQGKPEDIKTRPRLDLSKIGLGTKLPPPMPETPAVGRAGPRGPKQPHQPVGRDDPKAEKGNDNLLNAIESEYYSFFSRFEDPIVRNWFFLLRTHEEQMMEQIRARGHKTGVELPVTVEFVLDRKGVFRRIDVIESSQIPILDWATKEAVRKLGQLPNPPPGIFKGEEFFRYRLRFMVSLTNQPIVNANPGLRWY